MRPMPALLRLIGVVQHHAREADGWLRQVARGVTTQRSWVAGKRAGDRWVGVRHGG